MGISEKGRYERLTRAKNRLIFKNNNKRQKRSWSSAVHMTLELMI